MRPLRERITARTWRSTMDPSIFFFLAVVLLWAMALAEDIRP